MMGKLKFKLKKCKIDDLIPYVKNARLHPQRQINYLISSIKEFGYVNPILVTPDNVIIAGHGRLEALRSMGVEEIEVIEVDGLSDVQVKAYRIADNRLAELGEWDNEILTCELKELFTDGFDISLLGWDEKEIKKFDKEMVYKTKEITGEEDNVELPEGDILPVTQTGDLWILGVHRLLCGDATKEEDVKRLMDGKKADMVFTDPPYGVSYADKNKFLNQYDKGNRVQKEIRNDHLSGEKLYDFLFLVFSNILNVLAEYNSFYITFADSGELYPILIQALRDSGLGYKHTLIWNKNNHVLGRVDYFYKHEPILYGWVGKHKFHGKGKYTKSVWDIPKPQKSDLHPTMKPVELIENAVLNSTFKGQIVLDIFGGSGSTLIACEKTGRICYMMEIDPHYCDVIVWRYFQYTESGDIVLIREGKEYYWDDVKDKLLERFHGKGG